jgi:hypothetical protein
LPESIREESLMARKKSVLPPTRNTAPMWKKVSVVLSAPIAVVVVVRLLHADTWNFWLLVVIVIATAVLAVWGSAKLLGVRLSLGSWD